MIIVQHTILTSKLNSRWRACQVSETVWCGPGQTASVNMTLISHRTLVYYTLHFLLQCYWEMWVTFRHLEHSQKSHTKKVHNIFLLALVVRFVRISWIYITSQWLKRCIYHDWGCKTSSYQTEGCLRMFSLLIKDPPSNPRPPTPPYIRYLACEQALLFVQAKRASRERASEGPHGLAARSRVFARLASLAQTGELAPGYPLFC